MLVVPMIMGSFVVIKVFYCFEFGAFDNFSLKEKIFTVRNEL